MPLDVGNASVVDAESALKAFFKQHPVIAPLVGGSPPNTKARVFLGIPKGGPSGWPIIAISRIGGGPTDDDFPQDNARMQIDCWGGLPTDTGGGGGGKLQAFAVAQAVQVTLRNLGCGTLLDSGTRALGASTIWSRYVPDPTDGRPRYMVSCVLQAQSM